MTRGIQENYIVFIYELSDVLSRDVVVRDQKAKKRKSVPPAETSWGTGGRNGVPAEARARRI
jgi:hypothetical protein